MGFARMMSGKAPPFRAATKYSAEATPRNGGVAAISKKRPTERQSLSAHHGGIAADLMSPSIPLCLLLFLRDTLSQLISRRWRAVDADHARDVELRRIEPIRKM